ncbi:MAG: NAD(P)/FAD-dependent oxidoreductase [Planctomycetes bacterium]|jgi:thioredoxin reductase|nr:NAD(P)/FAD-dependent oxidoreductase [Planctomycetota bacterium]MCP4838520.1 NAD(P)/FAD-dependent oxidoreductase [Planctomycetota bacterium]
MQSVDVLIIGGGVGGLSCGMTLASAHSKRWFGDRTILIVDDAQSDLDKAVLRNAPGIEPGTTGRAVLQRMRSQVDQYGSAALIEDEIISVERSGEHWLARSRTGRCWQSQVLVLATGFKRWEIDGLPCSPQSHPRGGKPDRIMLEHDGAYRIDNTLYVASLLGGGSSQFAIAAGIGAQVAVEILSGWAGKRTHVHDVPETP